MKNCLLLIVFFLLPLMVMFSQDPTSSFPRSAIPPSPDAASLGKYGDIPVSLYTGLTEISIPILQISGRSLHLPVSLSYHAAGIKVDDVAGWTGLGWSLNAGGMISKIPKGIPDDEANGFLMYDVPELSELVFDQTFYEDVATGQRDTESDVYHYNFNGYSGKFFFDRDKNVQLIEEVPLKITYVPSSPGVSGKRAGR